VGFYADNFFTHPVNIITNFERQKYCNFLFMPIITFDKRLGAEDHYLGAVKGAIYNRLPGVSIVDISHDIPPFDLNQAAFIIPQFLQEFPCREPSISWNQR